MTHDTAPRQDARDLQARLYREIGISAVAAALRFTTQPDPAFEGAPRAEAVTGLDTAAAKPQLAETRVARAA